MIVLRRSTLPNAITVGRIVMAAGVAILVFIPAFTPRLLAFLLFLAAAFSDLWDGYLARKYGWVSDFGKLVDPLADKLLLAATVIPFYILSHGPGPVGEIPFWGPLPAWVLLVIFGREILITLIRAYAARRGVVIPAGTPGKYKAVFQNIFAGSVLFWYALETRALERGWGGAFWRFWELFHGGVVALMLWIALALTVLSLLAYLWQWRRLTRGMPGA
jgi:CDP-diacylglycerol---glycerol-3-phosphate 3-phosphatidyltransferase